ncbi:unnamed protein product [Urochloa humidicola]
MLWIRRSGWPRGALTGADAASCPPASYLQTADTPADDGAAECSPTEAVRLPRQIPWRRREPARREATRLPTSICCPQLRCSSQGGNGATGAKDHAAARGQTRAQCPCSDGLTTDWLIERGK